MLVQQAIHYFNQTNKAAGILSIDFAHAYDYISQEYIMEILNEFEFPPEFLNIVQLLMKNQKGRVLVNGDLSPIFDVENGGKQGDPLFPLIYIIANEGLSALLSTDSVFKGTRSPSGTKMTHVGYADDTAIFINSNQDELDALENILRIFQAASGNEIKLPKSYIFWLGSETGSNTEVFGIKPIVGSERYLGLMISSEFQAVENWNRIISNLPACVEHWSSFGLSVQK